MQSIEWRPVVGYEHLYRVSSDGQVIGPRGHVLRGNTNQDGYRMVGLRGVGKPKNVTIHKLVARAFIGDPDGLEVRHGDGDKKNNSTSNLSYGTHQENMVDLVRHGNHGQASKVACIRGHEFTTENTYNYRGTRICRACRAAYERNKRRNKNHG